MHYILSTNQSATRALHTAGAYKSYATLVQKDPPPAPETWRMGLNLC